MIYDLQKASIMKRIAAGIFDLILTVIIAVGVMWLLSAIFNLDSYSKQMEEYVEEYSVKYNIDIQKFSKMDLETYESTYSKEERAFHAQIEKEMQKDDRILKAYSLWYNLTIIMVTLGVLIGVLVIEFVVPLILGNGQTIGKKCFSICVMMQNGVKLKTFPLLARSLLGKFTIETMIPCYIFAMRFLGKGNDFQIILLLGLGILQLALIITNPFNTLLHDSLSFTTVVDKESQMIFETEDDLIKYKEKIALETEAKKRTF